MSEKRFKFPPFLERTESELAEEAKTQEMRRAAFGKAKLTPEERMVSRGVLLEETARGNLAAASEVKGKEARRQEREELKNLAHALFMQGRYEEAIKFHPFKRVKKFYQNIIDAIEKPDDDRCNCKDLEASEVKVTPRFARREVFSRKHGKVVTLIECLRCGDLNAREPASRLLVSKSAMNQNIAAAKAQVRGLVSDTQILK